MVLQQRSTMGLSCCIWQEGDYGHFKPFDTLYSQMFFAGVATASKGAAALRRAPGLNTALLYLRLGGLSDVGLSASDLRRSGTDTLRSSRSSVVLILPFLPTLALGVTSTTTTCALAEFG